MSENKLKAREQLENNFSKLIKVLEKEKSNYDEEKKKYLKSINEYEEKIKIIKIKINEISDDKNNFINENKEHLIPDKFHERDILKKRQELYEEIVLILNTRKDKIINDLNRYIEECQDKIDVYEKDTKSIKQAIWNGETLKMRINEVIDVEDLKKYYAMNQKIIEMVK